MARRYSLAHLTVLDLPPPRMVAIAARAGYDHVGIRLLPAIPGGPAYLLDDPAMLRETQAVLSDTGLSVFDIEIVRLVPEMDVSVLPKFFEVGQALGAKAILVGGYDPDEARLTANFAAFCEMAAAFGLTADLEPMPWNEVPDLARASRVLKAAGQPNAGILVDAIHFDRSASSLEELAALPPEWLHYVQLCDAPAEKPATMEGIIHAARSERLFPGEGGIDLPAMLRAMPRTLPVSLEVATETLARSVGHEERVRRALAGAKSVVARLEGAAA